MITNSIDALTFFTQRTFHELISIIYASCMILRAIHIVAAKP